MRTEVKSFINVGEIEEHLEKNTTTDRKRVEIIQKSLDKNRLDPDEVATLLNVRDPELRETIFEGARELKNACMETE